MNLLKKISATVLALSIAVSVTACTDTSYIGEVDGEQTAAGVYIYYQYQSLSEAQSHEDFDSELSDVWDNKLDDKDIKQWVYDNAVTKMKEAAYVDNKLEENGIALDQDDLDAVEYSASQNWPQYGEILESMGVSENSYKQVLTDAYASQKLFDYTYGEDGPLAVKDEDLQQYFTTDYANFRQIRFSFVDSEGKEIASTEKEAIKKSAEEYLEKVKANPESFDVYMKEYYDSLKTEEQLKAEKEAAEKAEDTDEEEDPLANVFTIQRDQPSYYASTKLANAVFNDAKIGEPLLTSDDSAYYVVLRYDVMEYPKEFEDNKDALLISLKIEEFQDGLTTASKDIKIDFNDASLNRYTVEKLLKK